MSLKEARFTILDEDEDGRRVLIADVERGLLLNDNRISCVLPEKGFEGALCKKGVFYSIAKNLELKKDYLSEYSFSCAVCQNACVNCKHICVTCKSPCQKCSFQSCKNSSTDTDDFDKYLESLTFKVKLPPKVKTVGTDTCDLEGHFDYYKFEKKTVRIQKSVATDCTDLIIRKFFNKRSNKNTVALDTSDLMMYSKIKSDDESDCEFFWTNKSNPKTYLKKSDTHKPLTSDDKSTINSLSVNEDSTFLTSTKVEEDNKENFNIESHSKVIAFDGSSSSDESDIDLATSCKISKCRKLARTHKITLNQTNNGKDIVFKCSICGKSFSRKHLGILHLGSHIDSNKFKCLSCNNEFETLDSLYSHVKESHSDTNYMCRPDDVIAGLEEGSENLKKVGRIYQCAICLDEGKPIKEFLSSKALCLHNKLEHGVESSKDSDSDINTDKKPRIRKEFICLFCGKEFKSAKALKDHSPVHTGEKNYHCDICKKAYTTSANLNIHKRTHTGARNFVCSVCGKAFHKKDSLKVHFRKHSGERPFQCDLCPMTFDRKYILKNHRYTHFSERAFICPVCGKTFTTHGGLNNHEKSHRKDPFAKKPRKPAVKPTLDAENAVICDVCGKIYSTKSNLRIHKFVHLGVKPFECPICHQTYAKKDSMLTHMRKHTDERPFACHTCGMTFYRNHTLKTHLMRHTGERPHKCNMCGKSFTQSSSLAYHVRNHDRKTDNKKVVVDDPTKQKKRRVNQNPKSTGPKKLSTDIKVESEYQSEDQKVMFDDKKTVDEPPEISVMTVHDKETIDLTKGGHFMVPMPEKEVVILDKDLGVELPRNINPVKDTDLFNLDKDFNTESNLGRYNYYIPKGHELSFSNDAAKSENSDKDLEIPIVKNDEDVENLIVSKNSYITKEGDLVTLNTNSSEKEPKEELVQMEEDLDLKSSASVPISGEILNAAFIDQQNGGVAPFSSMTVQEAAPENVMVSSVMSLEEDERKDVLPNPSLTMIDSKMTYSITSPRILNEKISAKGSCHVINIKEPGMSQKIQIEMDSSSLHVQCSLDDGETVHGISCFYNNVEQNEI